jgi:hypothetical protein
MAHAAIYGRLDVDWVGLYGGESDWDNGDYAPTYAINGVPLARWMSEQAHRQPRTVALVIGNSLAALRVGNVWAYQAESGYSEVTPGVSESLNVGGHNLAEYLVDQSGKDVLILLIDPAEGGDVTELLLAIIPGLDAAIIAYALAG